MKRTRLGAARSRSIPLALQAASSDDSSPPPPPSPRDDGSRSPSPPIASSQRRGRRLRAERYADVRAELISMKTKTLMGRSIATQQQRAAQPAVEAEQPLAATEREPEAQADEKQQQLSVCSLPAPRHSRVFRVLYGQSGSRRQQGRKAGFLLHHQAGHHHTLTLHSASSLLPFHTSLLPSHRAAPAASSALSIDGFELQLEEELTVQDWMRLQREAEEDRRRKNEERRESRRSAMAGNDGEAGFALVSRAVQLPR